MTPLDLQDSLKIELTEVLSKVLLKSGEQFNLYTQNLPPKKDAKDKSMFPYSLIKLGDGEDDLDDATQDIVIVFATYDNDQNYQGYRDVMNAIQKVREYLKEKQIIGQRYTVKYPIRWASPDDSDTYPYYFGAILVTFNLPQIGLVSENT
jgi:hypothetical protein